MCEFKAKRPVYGVKMIKIARVTFFYDNALYRFYVGSFIALLNAHVTNKTACSVTK